MFQIHFKGHVKPKHRMSSWAEKIIISNPAYAISSQNNSFHQLRIQWGGSQTMIWWQGGEGGGLDTPKSDDVIYEQPLILKSFQIPAMSKKTTIYIKPNFSVKRVQGQPFLLIMVPLTVLFKPYIILLSIANKPRHPQPLFTGRFSRICFAHHLSHDSYPAGRTRFEGR